MSVFSLVLVTCGWNKKKLVSQTYFIYIEFYLFVVTLKKIIAKKSWYNFFKKVDTVVML